jgi:uncharacterized protein (TIGR02996 family)
MVDGAVAASLVNEEIESVILEDPLDPSGWLVYGDWLQSEGDPRGELVAVQARLARDPGNAELMEAQRALFRQHGDALLEGLHPFLTPNEQRGPLMRLSWEFGFLWTANIRANGHTIEEVLTGLRALLRHPSAKFLHALSIATPPSEHWQRVVQVLVEDPEPRPLRILFLGDRDSGLPRPGFGALGDLSELWARFPHLESLAIRGGVMNVGTLDLPRLRELTIETSALQRETLLAVAAQDRANLTKLELWFGDRRCTCTINELAAVFEGSRLPRVTHLALRNCSFVDRICHALTQAPIARQLHVLDLSLGALTDMGAAALVDAKDHFTNLAVLDVSWNYFHRDWAAELAHLARFVDTQPATSHDEARRPKVWVDT